MASLGSGDGEPEFQIAPMIDVLLVLLIFFMSITSAEVLKIDKKLTLPVSPHAKKADSEMSKHELAVNCRLDESKEPVLTISDVVYDKTHYPEAIEVLKQRIGADPKLRVVIRADKDLPAIEIQRTMEVVAQGGISDIAFAASNK